MKTKWLLLFIISFSTWSCSNNNSNDEANLSAFEATNKEDEMTPLMDETGSDYYGLYHFGESEMETTLLIYGSRDNGYFAQLKSGEYNDDATDWIWHYENLKEVKIEGNQFSSNLSNGEFVVNESTGEVGLKIFDSWSYEGEEVGYKTGSAEEYYAGDYTEASLATLTADELKDWTKKELQIMRNEIFARYGFQFKKNGNMDTYFRLLDWFQPQHTSVDDFLTPLEKSNLDVIKKAEGIAVDETEPVKGEEMKEVLVGSWVCNSSKVFELKEDGSFHSEDYNYNETGTWWLNNNVLSILVNEDTVQFTISYMDRTEMVIEKVDFNDWHQFLCQTGSDYRIYSTLKRERPAMRNTKNALVGYWYYSEGFELKADGSYIHHGPDCSDGSWDLKDNQLIIKEDECGGMEMEFDYVSSDILVLDENWTLYRVQDNENSIPTPKSKNQLSNYTVD